MIMRNEWQLHHDEHTVSLPRDSSSQYSTAWLSSCDNERCCSLKTHEWTANESPIDHRTERRTSRRTADMLTISSCIGVACNG